MYRPPAITWYNPLGDLHFSNLLNMSVKQVIFNAHIANISLKYHFVQRRYWYYLFSILSSVLLNAEIYMIEPLGREDLVTLNISEETQLQSLMPSTFEKKIGDQVRVKYSKYY